ncbi:hypothetical protein [Actinoplanes aureus]|uniref:Uncharacterized protein n=1 Tax=Actinoplanes aureus TaxID=2792083 RepID=A0A931CIF5_9ACTN|nr:hypothetical protein [Actinoplanes aureus]MBG0567908.1 hypothetical protein [Actinoplanes aureus]
MWLTVIKLERPSPRLSKGLTADVVRERLLGADDRYEHISFSDTGEIVIYYKNSAENASRATLVALTSFEDLLKATALSTLTPYAVDTHPAQMRPRLRLAGTGEMAEIFGRSKARISQLKKSAGFPEPIAELEMGPVYLEIEILEYKAARDSISSPKKKTEGHRIHCETTA